MKRSLLHAQRGQQRSAALYPVGWAATLAALMLLFAGCEKAGPTSQSTATPSSDAVDSSGSGRAGITTKSGVKMVLLPGGEFTMGSDRGSPDEAPAHKVKLSAFLMDTFEVTHEMFAKVQLSDPSHWQDNAQTPVERVRWRDAKRYCDERSLLEGLKPCYNEKTSDWDCDYAANGYRLPTEAEWEYACRAGSDSPYDFGSLEKLRQFAWFSENAEQKTHPAGQKKPNGFGIYDLYGNVSEWCEDVYSPLYYKESPTVDPHGPANPGKDVKRVIRGGSWKFSADQCRASARQGERTGDTDACFSTDYCGFRCVRRATPEELKGMR
jgi:formylglycine-generating enzyme required for sulfatase activity